MEAQPIKESQQFNGGRSHFLSGTAIGMVSTQSFPAIVGTADMMLKAAGVTLIGFEKIGSGHCTAVVRGNIADVRIAVQVGAETAEQFGQLVSHTIIPRPMPNLEVVLPISSRLAEIVQQQGFSKLSNQAIGLLETRGFPAMVGAADAMLKAAEVNLAAYEVIGDGLCTAIIRGRVSDVAIAIEVGMHEAERIGELHAIIVIPRPLDDLEVAIPMASYWMEQLTPLQLPLEIKETQKELVAQEHPQEALKAELVELPNLQELTPSPIEQPEE